jgi:hypothetical protein
LAGQSREAGQAALAAAGLPELGILAVTDQGIHVLTTDGILRSSPEEEVLFLPAGSQYDERPMRYTFRNPEIASDDWTRIDRARRPRSCVYRDAGGFRELWVISYRHSAFRCSQRA